MSGRDSNSNIQISYIFLVKIRDGNEPESCESSRVRVPKSEFFVGFCEFESSRVKKKCEFELESQVS